MIPPDLSIEYSFVKLPYDCAVTEFKNSKKFVEKEISSVLNAIIKLKNDETLNKVKANDTINELITRLKNLKKKIGENYNEQDRLYENCKKRILHLNETMKGERDSIDCYHKIRLNRIVIDYLVRQGDLKTARAMMKEYKIEDFTELEIRKLEESLEILSDLKNHSCELALRWCATNKSKLQKLKSKFELKIVFQIFIEFLRRNEIKQALEFLKSKSDVTELFIDDLKKVMGCLICYKNFDNFPDYKYFFEEERWKELIDMFKKENFRVFSITMQSPLSTTLQAGLASLKTIYCYIEDYKKRDECPVCNEIMQKIAKSLPATLKTVSSLICRITGEIMDEHNPPIMLPNGEIYSQKAILEMCEKNNGILTCPQTNEVFKMDQTTKIFLS